ncbi:radical SAM/SPASM domain-containing protein [Chloroflexota bacterium]
MLKRDIVIPERIQLELVFGCNASCIMCPVHIPSQRKKGIMSLDLFKKIVDEMAQYNETIDKFDLWGLGEPLLDKGLYEKIEYAKSKGFRNLAIATNADLLKEEYQSSLLESGLDTVIFSIDGNQKATHESIRKGVNFDNVIDNVWSIIEKRNNGDYKTRFVFRFIRQESNINEWGEYQEFWKGRISPDKGDLIIGYDAHNWGGEILIPGNSVEKKELAIEKKPCHHVYDRLIVLWDGTIPLCCTDMHHAEYAVGNVNDASSIEVFNNEKISNIREFHMAGKKNNMDICQQCTILYSEATQDIID